MKKYDSYKDSGVEWIGDIPQHWENLNLGNIFTVSGRIGWKNLRSDEYVDEPNYIFLSTPNLKGKEIDFVNVNYITKERYDESPEIMLELDDILLVKSGSTLGIVNIIRDLPKPTTVNGSSVVLKKRNESELGSFYNYLMGSNYFQNLMKITQGGVGVPSVNQSDIRKFKLLKPPLSEQQQIVSFLDTKTSLIDSLIEKTQRKIELLKEKRTSLINEVVTKGLNPNVEMKDSGVEWIGEIPSHYQIGKLKDICNENQRSLSNSTNPNYELNYIEISDVNSEGVIGNHTPYIFSESPSRCRRVVQKGDVIVSTVRTYLKSIGLIEEEVEDLICSTGFSVLSPNIEINSKYLFYLLRTEWFISMVISKSEGVSYPSIQSEKLMNIDVVFCKISEQQQIVEYLDEQTQLIDNTISVEEKRIELLKEYRQSLISEVITGKRKVVK